MLLTSIDDDQNVKEAQENLKVIRDIMERSTKHSTLSGLSGLLAGVWTLLGVAATHLSADPSGVFAPSGGGRLRVVGPIWCVVLILCVATDYLLKKRRAPAVGKQIFSPLGKHIFQAIAPAFFAGLALTAYFVITGLAFDVWAYWMLAYGLAICAVGQFSVKPVAYLGWAFVLAGACTLFMPPWWDLWMMAVSFGGFHILYGLYTGLTRGDW